MTDPGQQAAQQAAASAAQASRHNAANAHHLNVQAGHRAAHNHYRRPRGPRRGGVFGLLGRLIGFVFALVVIAVAVAIALMVLSQANPDLFTELRTWFDGLF